MTNISSIPATSRSPTRVLRFLDRTLRLIASPQQRRLTRYRALADRILALDGETRALSDAALRQRADDLRHRARAGASLDALTIPTFALVREAARRTLGEAHVVEQLIGALALRDGAIAEMKTGEGKTLTATLVAALHALAGRGVHLAAPNDYLAARDADWMRPIYALLGFGVGLITPEIDDDARRAAYACDVTYGVASEFGLDFLRDHLKFCADETVQRGHGFALVDEADATLIDDAGVPLALDGPLGDQSDFYHAVDAIVAALTPEHYELDQRRRVALTDAGYDAIDHALRQAGLLKPDASLHDTASIALLHHVMQALRARTLLKRDRDYVVAHDEVVIVDAFTGRMLPGRRYDDALHQALEAKENCPIGEETRTLASITFQSYFRRYDKLAGMTGTAGDEIEEYRQIYGLDVVAIPPHRPMIRRDAQMLHRTRDEALAAVLAELEAAHAIGQPVLIGTPSIAACDRVAATLEANGWQRSRDRGPRRFAVLNAKHHADEARIIAQAGRPFAVTLATAMAGRGTDIKLGGTPFDAALQAQARGAGGLLVIGTEHHAHRRRDAQLRGRAGRQGDPGRSVVHASIDDELLRGHPAPVSAGNGPMEPATAQRLIDAAQRRREARSFDQRLALSRFDAVIERQRDALIAQRAAIRDDPAPLQLVAQLRNDTIDDLMQQFAPPQAAWDIENLDAAVRSILTLAVPIAEPGDDRAAAAIALQARIGAIADDWMAGKVHAIGEAAIGAILRRVMLALLDQLWTEQTERLEHLKRMIGDRHLPPHRLLPEFQLEAFALFELLAKEFRHEVTAHAMRLGRPS
uniref:Protein translocase subunit SecA 2 n=1 Tax=Rhodopseudomonas palustris (strain BisA53) TaxID=316055 RepID=SECA2_RHOP5|nr:RecName: Full=Protein translocase subunit SecA 2 [Rhodopseudomonas palustris BisA53]